MKYADRVDHAIEDQDVGEPWGGSYSAYDAPTDHPLPMSWPRMVEFVADDMWQTVGDMRASLLTLCDDSIPENGAGHLRPDTAEFDYDVLTGEAGEGPMALALLALARARDAIGDLARGASLLERRHHDEDGNCERYSVGLYEPTMYECHVPNDCAVSEPS